MPVTWDWSTWLLLLSYRYGFCQSNASDSELSKELRWKNRINHKLGTAIRSFVMSILTFYRSPPNGESLMYIDTWRTWTNELSPHCFGLQRSISIRAAPRPSISCEERAAVRQDVQVAEHAQHFLFRRINIHLYISYICHTYNKNPISMHLS